MTKRISKKKICLTAIAAALLASLSIGTAMAYFTTYATAEGGVEIDLGFTETEINESVVDGQKEIQLENIGAYDCYVRLKALTGDAYIDSLVYSEPSNERKWTPGPDGYYYYSDIVKPGEMTTQLNVEFAFPSATDDTVPADFNVIIVQEHTPVLYDAEGNPCADWNKAADVCNEASVDDDAGADSTNSADEAVE